MITIKSIEIWSSGKVKELYQASKQYSEGVFKNREG